MSNPVNHRFEFILYFDVTNGNPNGDPDAGDMPRVDSETGHGLVSDVALKRKIRNFVTLVHDDNPGFEIYLKEGATLNTEHKRAWAAVLPEVGDFKTMRQGPKDRNKAHELTRWMCANFWDIRTFGAVMSTGVNAGQVRGPVQLAFARSVEPIMPIEILLTRAAVTSDKFEDRAIARTMGRKYIVPYALYRVHGYVSAPLASHPTKGTGFSEADLELLWRALGEMFEHDRSAARGEMASRKLIVFRHQSALGNAQAQSLFARVKTWRVLGKAKEEVDSPVSLDWPPARRWEDYRVTIDRDGLPAGIDIISTDFSGLQTGPLIDSAA